MHGTDLQLLDIKRTWTLESGRFFTEREQEDAEQVMVLGQVVAEKLFGAGVDPVGQTITLWKQPFRVVGVVTSASWVVRPAPGDDEFDAVYMPYTTTHRLLNLTKLNDITVTAASTGEVSDGGASGLPRSCASVTASPTRSRTTSRSRRRRRARSRPVACRQTWPRPSPATSRSSSA